jgi:hypothetical protein
MLQMRCDELFRTRLARWLIAGATLLALAPTAHATNFMVGGAGCDYSTINAAVAAAGASSNSNRKIYIAANQSYTGQAIVINNFSVQIIGGIPDCSHLTPSTNVVISGKGGANAPVLKIIGGSTASPLRISLDHVSIQDGHSGSTDGGGISFSGIGTLSMTSTEIFSNTANYGAGINFKANGGNATLSIGADTYITNNTAANSGGGIRIEGQGATMNMNAANTWVALNEATAGLGGGIEVINEAFANIGSPGYANLPVVYENTAKYGGGIAVSEAYLNLYTTDPLHPVAVDSNTAFNTGGGLYFAVNSPSGSNLCAANIRITNNIAQEGSGLYSDVDSDGDGGQVYINTQDFCHTELATFGSVPCDPSQACNIVHGNYAMAVQSGNQPTNGAALLLQSGTIFGAAKLDVRDNHGGYALRALGNNINTTFYTQVSLSNCLFADNVLTHELILVSDGNAHTDLYNCTFAHDTIGTNRVMAIDDTLSLNDSIINEGPIAALAFSGSDSSLRNLYNIADNITGMAASPYNIQGRPTFVDVAHGDYRLFYGFQGGQLVKSLGIDYAAAANGNDIRNMPRDQQVSTTPLFGTRDIGAYEMQGVGDRIFVDTFGDNLLLVH